MMTLERYSHVMHMTSQVSGRLPRRQERHRRAPGHAAGRHRVGRARRCGPWRSSTTSSPPSAGPYAGVVGYLDFSGNIDTAIAIRTLVVGDDGRASVQAGAGIVADSVAEHEDLECHNKARALLAAIPAARRMTARRRAHAGRTRHPCWVAFRHGGSRRPPHDRGRGADRARRRRGVGPGGHRLPAGPAQPGRRRPRRRASRPGRSCSSPPGRSTRGCASPGPATSALALDVDAGLRRRRAGPAAALQAPHEGGAGAAPRWSGWALRGPSVERRERHGAGACWRCPPAGPGCEGVDLLSGTPSTGPAGSTSSPIGRPRGAAHRVRRAGDGRRAHRGHDPRRGRPVADRRVGELHQGLLHGPGARRPHRQPGRQRARARSAACSSTAIRRRSAPR